MFKTPSLIYIGEIKRRNAPNQSSLKSKLKNWIFTNHHSFQYLNYITMIRAAWFSFIFFHLFFSKRTVISEAFIENCSVRPKLRAVKSAVSLLIYLFLKRTLITMLNFHFNLNFHIYYPLDFVNSLYHIIHKKSITIFILFRRYTSKINKDENYSSSSSKWIGIMETTSAHSPLSHLSQSISSQEEQS